MLNYPALLQVWYIKCDGKDGGLMDLGNRDRKQLFIATAENKLTI